MFFNNGSMMFNDVGELTYNVLMAIGLDIKNEYVFDQDNGEPIMFQGKMIKASVDSNNPCYAGQNDVTFDILTNVRLVTTLLGYCIDKETALNGFSCLSHFIEESQDEDPANRSTALSIKMSDYSTKTTKYYYNKCLKYIHAIFLVYDDNVDLSNFDSIEGI